MKNMSNKKQVIQFSLMTTCLVALAWTFTATATNEVIVVYERQIPPLIDWAKHRGITVEGLAPPRGRQGAIAIKESLPKHFSIRIQKRQNPEMAEFLRSLGVTNLPTSLAWQARPWGIVFQAINRQYEFTYLFQCADCMD